MRFAKPPTGFKVNCLPEARADIAAICEDDQACIEYKNGVVEKLRHGGHRLGQDLNWRELPGARLYKTVWRTPLRALEARVIYRVLGETITFYRVEIARDLRVIT